MSRPNTENAGVLPSVSQQQIDEAERLGRLFGLTYLSIEGYAKLAALLEHARYLWAPPKFEMPKNIEGWRVG